MRIKLVLVGLTVSALAGGGHLARLGAQQAQEMRSTRDGVYNEEQVARGVIAFETTCGDCHGYELEGGEEAPPLIGGTFLANWNDLTLRDLSDRIRTTMPPNDTRSVSREKIADIISFVLSANDFPAGESELPADSQLLRLIRIDAFGR
jgi:mono/diheme cytochrome c family protein